jgi:uncharacterized membrane protein
VEVNKITVIAISGIVLLTVAALALVAVHLWRKKSQTEHKYALLVQVLTLHTTNHTHSHMHRCL